MIRNVLLFSEGSREMRDVLGGKGANLADMTNHGLPVPPGFTITTASCNRYYEEGQRLQKALIDEVEQAMQQLESMTGKVFGGKENPLLVSVRSGAAISMPGMMDTILNLGLNDETVQGLIDQSKDKRFALDCYRRFIQMFGNVVLGIEHHVFEIRLQALKEQADLTDDTQVTAEQWEQLVSEYKKLIKKHTKEDFPQDVKTQLLQAIEAVFRSWNNQRAKIYRKINNIPDSIGTAVNVQMMVFGNLGDDCGTGVAFTRNPSTGEKKIFGEFLVNAQGEDVVAGIRTPRPIAELAQTMPAIYEQFVQLCNLLEHTYKDMQDIEFTVERGKLYILQTRNGKRTSQASLKILVDLVDEGVIDTKEALRRVDAEQLGQSLHRRIDPDAKVEVAATGLPASPGSGSGSIVFTADHAEEQMKKGLRTILVRPETTPEDIHGILAAEAILTARGGMTSHAAVVARGMGKPCVCGCEQLSFDPENNCLWIGEQALKEGDWITVDGSTGRVILGAVPMIDPELTEEMKKILEWADQYRKLLVMSNADNPVDARRSVEYGAQGVGLCRTEHMFMDPERIPVVQNMILADSFADRKQALDQLLPMQEEDFYGILLAMDGLPVTIRLLDPPLHEFLPRIDETTSGSMDEAIVRKVKALHESNPMLGHRGCRLGITYPEIYEMQVNAICRATKRLIAGGMNPIPEIMIPLIGHVNELRILREMVERVIQKEGLADRNIPIGTMIELPRAAVTADQIAQHADFFSFGTNDLTQTTFAFSRDDAEGKFLQVYVDQEILPANPFMTLDVDGVGQLIRMGVEKGKKTNAQLKTGICGEHGGDPKSIAFCHEVGLKYVSCSPFRLPIARVAAAQVAIAKEAGC
ncbi:pyruvate, phosphate dikinase [Fodinisporobacter ferrooxydans]|uniref:Pyruvate, phosphate dikinase n=1 Tax=Fodinisporobacter ferrooxydans TaxID=2901836 RepID=A0ABY4CEI7_9BACL|nr:pyruvate, phosphate dikinase [Alicyclobacillaceae bacterium MYW30-H2]